MNRDAKFYTISLVDINAFTLIELLISIFIFSIVVSTVYGSYKATFHVIRSSQSKYADLWTSRMVLERIQDDLSGLVITSEGNLQGEAIELSGKRCDNLQFISWSHLLLSPKDMHKGHVRLKYHCEIDDQSESLNLLRTDIILLPGNAASESTGTTYIIAKGIDAFQIDYIDSEGVETDTWVFKHNSAEGENAQQVGLPELINIGISFKDHATSNKEGSDFSTVVAMPIIEKAEE